MSQKPTQPPATVTTDASGSLRRDLMERVCISKGPPNPNSWTSGLNLEPTLESLLQPVIPATISIPRYKEVRDFIQAEIM